MNKTDRINRDGEIVRPHAFKFEKMYYSIFKWFHDKKDLSMADVVRKAVERRVEKLGGDASDIESLNIDEIKKGENAEER